MSGRKWLRFRHMKALKTNNSLSSLDVAFIEGAISSESQAKEARRIRESAKYVVVIGACACTGQPSTSRNQFVSEQINDVSNDLRVDGMKIPHYQPGGPTEQRVSSIVELRQRLVSLELFELGNLLN